MVINKDGDFLIIWRIENFNAIAALSNYDVWTPPIPSQKLFEVDHFILLICPLDTELKYISIYLYPIGKEKGSANSRINVEFFLIDKNGDEQFKQKCEDYEISNKSVCSEMSFLLVEKLFGNKEEFIPNGALTLVCRIQKSSNRSGFTGMKSQVYTEILVERSAFHWSIRDQYLDKRVIRFESDLVKDGFVVKWESSKTDSRNLNKKLLNLVIKPKSLPNNKITMSATIQAVCSQTNLVSKVEGIYAFEDGKDAWYLGGLDISGLMGNHQELDLLCELSVSNGKFKSHVEEILFHPLQFHNDANTLKDDISALFDGMAWKFPSYSTVVTSGGITDIMLSTSDYPYALPVHKMILAARSPLLNNILSNYDKKKKNWLLTTGGKIPIIECKVTAGNDRFKVYMNQGQDIGLFSNISSSTLFQLVKCMYKDTLDTRNIDAAIELYRAGIDFDFNLLKSKSRDYLRSKVSLSALEDLLPFAYEVGDELIKRDFLNFISKNQNLVFASKEWSRLCANFPRAKKVVLIDLYSNYDVLESI